MTTTDFTGVRILWPTSQDPCAACMGYPEDLRKHAVEQGEIRLCLDHQRQLGQWIQNQREPRRT